MMRKKPSKPGILHLISSLETGGTEKLLLDFTEAFGEAERPLELVVVVVNDKFSPYLRSELERHCSHVYFLNRSEGSKDLRPLLGLFHIVKRHRVAAIHTHDHGSKHFAMLCKLRKPSIKLLFSVHNKFLFDSLSPLKLRLHRSLIDHNIAISGSVLQYCLDNGVTRSSVIYNGIRLSRFSPGKRTFMEDGTLRIVNVARITHAIKGQDVLIKALRHLSQHTADFECHFIGGQYEYDHHSLPYLQGLVAEYGLQKNAKFLGNVENVASLLPSYDLFVLPSRTEGFGLVLLEALASGLAVIASNIEGPAELLQNGRLGKLFETGNDLDLYEKILQVYERDYAIIRTRSETQELENFDISVMTQEYIDLYCKILGSAVSCEVHT